MVSFEVIGSREKAVAIVEIPEELERRKVEIAKEIMERHKNVKSVLKKASERKGIYRIRKFELILGEKNTEVIHKEFGCRLKLDPTKVYFSPREGTERARIASQVKPGETIMLMFAGIGAYAVIIAKKQLRIDKIICVEINPEAFKYMQENIRLNKLQEKIIPILGDVREKCVEWFGKCDRVIMPLPHEAINFLDIAISCLKKKGGFIHLYLIEKEEKADERAKSIVKNLEKKIGKKVKFNLRKVLPYAPRVFKYCLDIEI